jgi:hypothetical protein
MKITVPSGQTGWLMRSGSARASCSMRCGRNKTKARRDFSTG